MAARKIPRYLLGERRGNSSATIYSYSFYGHLQHFDSLRPYCTTPSLTERLFSSKPDASSATPSLVGVPASEHLRCQSGSHPASIDGKSFSEHTPALTKSPSQLVTSKVRIVDFDTYILLHQLDDAFSSDVIRAAKDVASLRGGIFEGTGRSRY